MTATLSSKASADSLSPRAEHLVEPPGLTAVETFARRHDERTLPAHETRYRDLLPLSAPRPGEQYAFEVDLDACSGCKACVTACHSLNGLDEDETWRSVGLLLGGSSELPILQHVTTACHHCIEPACLAGCPVLAYEKDPITGIVRHLDDQCIGCQYCILKCPYDVPKYNRSRGIVRKCDMCSDRLAAGEPPACAQACPNEAIRITIVAEQRIIDESEGNVFLPGAAEPDYTLPTTQYRTTRPSVRNLLPADHYQVAPEHAHLPLVVMLVLTQLCVGAFAAGEALAWLAGESIMTALRPLHALAALGWGVLAFGASILHLGRPLYAFRAVIGLRTSWLSREIVAFGLFGALAAVYAAILCIGPSIRSAILDRLGLAVAAAGLLGIVCSIMVYHDTRRVFWRGRYTGTKFLLSTILLGVATTLLTATLAAAASPTLALEQMLRGWGRIACQIIIATAILKLAFEALTFRFWRDRHHTPMKRTARLLAGPLRRATVARFALGIVGGVAFPALAILESSAGRSRPGDVAPLIVAAYAMILAGELLERYLFFTAVVAPKMPGGLTA